jgi:hypothetical protein
MLCYNFTAIFIFMTEIKKCKIVFQLKNSLQMTQLENHKLKIENDKQSKEILKLRREKTVFKAKLKVSKAAVAKAKVRPPTKAVHTQIVTDLLLPHFTSAQISCILRGEWHRSKKWSHEDIALAVTLCSLSPKSYRFLRKQKIVPLPGESTIKEFFRNFRVPQGYLKVVGKMVQLMLEDRPAKDRVVIISFDEIYLRLRIDYDRQEDQVLGPHKRANTMMVRGLYSNWKVPIWYCFDNVLSKKELFSIIKELEDIGVHVVGNVSDMGGSNRGLQKKLGVTIDRPYFPHPTRLLQ